MGQQAKENRAGAETPVTDEAAANASENLRRFMRSYGHSQADVGRILGVSNTMISLVLHNKYRGDVLSLTRRISDFVNDDLRNRLNHLQILDAQVKAATQILSQAITNCGQIGERNGRTEPE